MAKLFPRALLAVAAIGTITISGVAAVHAQEWPQRPIRVIVPFAAGSSPDILARIVNDRLSARISQPLIVDNKPGAGGNTGTDQASKAQPDGYTFLVSVNAPLVYNTILYKNLPYDPFKDLVPVSLAATTPNVCVVSNSMKVESVKDWLTAMKQSPGNSTLRRLATARSRIWVWNSSSSRPIRSQCTSPMPLRDRLSRPSFKATCNMLACHQSR